MFVFVPFLCKGVDAVDLLLSAVPALKELHIVMYCALADMLVVCGVEWKHHMELFIALGDVSSSILMPIIRRWFAWFVRNIHGRRYTNTCGDAMWIWTRIFSYQPIYMHTCCRRFPFSHYVYWNDTIFVTYEYFILLRVYPQRCWGSRFIRNGTSFWEEKKMGADENRNTYESPVIIIALLCSI